MIDRQKIQEILPHREPFLFVDKILSFDAGKSIVAELNLDAGLPFFKGHFPNEPIMPGVLTTESLAQTAGILIGLSDEKRGAAPEIFYLASSNMKFSELAKAGDTLTLKADIVKSFQGLAQFRVEALCGKTSIASGTLVLAARDNAKK